jgi:hypothetical protein
MGRMKELRYIASGEQEYDIRDWWPAFRARMLASNEAEYDEMPHYDSHGERINFMDMTKARDAYCCWCGHTHTNAQATCICAPRPDGYFVGHPDCRVHGTNAQAT